MSTPATEPGRVVQSRIAAPEGALVEAVLDENGSAWARFYIWSRGWTPWELVASGAADIDVAASSTDPGTTLSTSAYMIVTPAEPSGRRSVFCLSGGKPVTTVSMVTTVTSSFSAP